MSYNSASHAKYYTWNNPADRIASEGIAQANRHIPNEEPKHLKYRNRLIEKSEQMCLIWANWSKQCYFLKTDVKSNSVESVKNSTHVFGPLILNYQSKNIWLSNFTWCYAHRMWLYEIVPQIPNPLYWANGMGAIDGKVKSFVALAFITS